ncbi:MAG TPA: hypothetical protein VN137_15055, partial [Sphingomonas sp.]|nr:hypothetical protein [Sphingomonas sp.]
LELRRERAARLREAAARRKAAWLESLIGTTQQILVEAPGDRGHGASFADFAVGSRQAVGSILPIVIDPAHIRHPRQSAGDEEREMAVTA